MEYDQEFEDYCMLNDITGRARDFAYNIWQAARASKPEQKTIELQGGGWSIAGDGISFFSSSESYKNAGKERKTEVEANKAAQFMLKRDRLAAFVYEHCGFECEWEQEDCDSYIYIRKKGEFDIMQDSDEPDLCKQYMPYDTAQWLCEKLNSGEIVL